YVLFALPTFASRRMSARSRSRRECDGFLVALTSGHHGPRLLAILLASAIAATLVGALAVIRYAKIHGTKHRPWLTTLLAGKYWRSPQVPWPKAVVGGR